MTLTSNISEAASLLRNGQLVAFPTETVYGLGADATSDVAVAGIFAAKKRPQFNPLISHVANAEAAFQLGHFTPAAEKLAVAFWPGPLTIVVERRRHCPVSLLCSSGLPTLGLRVPRHSVALELLNAVGRPVAAPSANLSGRISPTTAAHVKASLGTAVDLILDGGPALVGLESTVVRFVDGKVLLLRTGGTARDAIEAIIGQRVEQPDMASSTFHAPGQQESHYAPQARLRLNALEPAAGEVYLGFGQHDHGPWTLSKSGHLEEAAANLFKILHQIDEASPQTIAVAPIPNSGLGEAINDRLMRAAAPRPTP